MITRDWLLANGVDEATLGEALGRSMPTASGPNARPLAAGFGLLPIVGSSGPWRVEMPWRPPSLNRLLRMHWSVRARAGKRADRVVGTCCYASGVTHAFCKRRVSLDLGYRRPNATPLDEDNAFKLLLDALVSCSALVDDGPRWVERGTYSWTYGRDFSIVTLEETNE